MRIGTRAVTGAGAWLAGAAAATGLCLWAVSYLGTASDSAQGVTLDADQVHRALASATATDAAGAGTAPTPDPTTAGATLSPSSATATATAPAGSAPAPTSPSASPASSAAPQTVDRRLSASSGTVTAQCQGTVVFLTSWSPALGYQVQGVQRGPARQATVVFAGAGRLVHVQVFCVGGAPTLTTGEDEGGVDR